MSIPHCILSTCFLLVCCGSSINVQRISSRTWRSYLYLLSHLKRNAFKLIDNRYMKHSDEIDLALQSMLSPTVEQPVNVICWGYGCCWIPEAGAVFSTNLVLFYHDVSNLAHGLLCHVRWRSSQSVNIFRSRLRTLNNISTWTCKDFGSNFQFDTKRTKTKYFYLTSVEWLVQIYPLKKGREFWRSIESWFCVFIKITSILQKKICKRSRHF